MYITIKHQYRDASAYASAVVLQPITKTVFMKHIREAVEKLFNRTNVILNNHRMYANVLEHYLNKYEISEIVPNEEFFGKMLERFKHDGVLNGKEYRWMTRKKVPPFTRHVINEYFFPKGMTQRKIAKEIIKQRYDKFLQLTENSQKAISWFEAHGKRVEALPVYVEDKDKIGGVKTIHRVTKRELLPVTKSGKIDHALRFLHDVKKNGFELATDSDVKKFEDCCIKRGVKQTQDYLAHVASFFINIHDQGFIKHNPFAHTSLQMSGSAVKEEFISSENMEIFRNLATVDMNSKENVRDRLIVLLAYDLALRINEFLGLEVSDFKKDSNGERYVLLRKEIQKGHKNDEVMYFFFDETKELLEIYLKKIRQQFNPITDHLIISGQGKPLSSQQCSRRFKELCERFKIMTYYGKSPSPHVLRHSFATLNIEPIGLSIPLYEMAQRLRHSRVETTRKNYIHNNPYLKKIKHDVLRKNVKKKTPVDILNGITLPDLEHWLSDTLNLDASIIRTIRGNHKKAFSDTQVDNKPKDNIMYLTEEEALAKLKPLEIPALALRQYAIKQGFLAEGFQGKCRHGKGFRYVETFVNELAKNWIPVKNLQNKLRMPMRTFQYMVSKERWRTKQIGKYRFIHRDDCI